MIVIEIIYGILFLVLSFLATKSDIQDGLIYNQQLKIFGGLSILLGIIYYGWFARDLFCLFLINFILVSLVSLLLFYTHSFAGGDCKLTIVLASLYPANYYLMYGNLSYTLIFALGFSMVFGYFYMVFSALKSLAIGENKISIDYIKNYFYTFIKNFVISMLYISGINLIFYYIEIHGITINSWLLRSICMLVTWLVSQHEITKKWYCLLVIILFDVVAGIYLSFLPFSIDPSSYILIIALLLCQMTISTNLYDEIQISELKKGMILSTFSSVMMQGSRIQGLPQISSEDLKDRLKEEEVESVKRWATATKMEYITIVKKIPFAIFISLGFISYFIIWRLLL